jgi:ABC-type glycerol-3-phosphate transport system substrate-binding protein
LQHAGKLQAMNDLFPASYLDAFASSTLTGASQGGRLWGLPDTVGFQLLLFYNRNLVEQPPTTTDELVDLAQGLTTNSQWGLVLNSQDPLWIVPWLWAYEGWLVDGDGTPTLNSAAMVRALTLHLSWHAGEAPIAPIASRVEAQELFTTGKAAMMIDGDWAIDELTQDSQIPWGVAVLPQVTDANQPPGPLVLGRYWAVSRASGGLCTEGSIAFLEFMTQPDQQLNWTKSFGLLPSRRDALNNPAILTDPALHVSVTQLQSVRGLPLNADPNRLLDAMRPPLEQMLVGELTPTEAAAAMQDKLP